MLFKKKKTINKQSTLGKKEPVQQGEEQCGPILKLPETAHLAALLLTVGLSTT